MTVTPATTHVGFIGLGIMGGSMAAHIQAAGYPLHVYARTPAKAQSFVDKGAIRHETIADLAAACDVVITIVGYPTDVEQVYFGTDGVAETGILANLKPGAVAIDMTTSSPSLAKRLAKAAADKGAFALDAPVSGGDVGAREATLAIMVGGDQTAYEKVLPILKTMGQGIDRLGPAGAGQHTKMVNQTVIAGTIMGVAEAMAYAKAAGLDQQQVLKVIGGGAAGGYQLRVLGKRMIEGDFAPGFYVHHFLKDMGIAASEAERMGLDMPALDLARQQYTSFSDKGGREDGTQGLYKMLVKS